MRKRNTEEHINNIAVGIDQLQIMLGVGRNTADKIGKEAGAVMHVGRRKLFNVNKIQAYLDDLSEAQK